MSNCYWDMDECLIHTMVNEIDLKPGDFDFEFTFKGDSSIYRTKIRPHAHDALKLSRDLFGNDRVFMLTYGIREYALLINDRAQLGFAENQILAREDWSPLVRHIRYDPDFKGPHIDPDNILIDNLKIYYNSEKTTFLGIKNPDNYLQVDDYYGVEFEFDNFLQRCTKFLKRQARSKGTKI